MYDIYLSIALVILILIIAKVGTDIIFNTLVFRTSSRIRPNELDVEFEELNIPSIDNINTINMIYYNNKKCNKLIIAAHGNSNNIWQTQYIIKYLSNFGNVIIYDYQGYGKSTGSPSEQNVYNDARTVWDFAITQGYTPENIILYGESLGGAITLHLASTLKDKGPKAVIIRSSFSNINILICDIFGDFHPLTLLSNTFISGQFDSQKKIQNISKNTKIYIMHSKDDGYIPISHSRKLIEHAHHAEFIEINGTHAIPDFGDKLNNLLDELCQC